MIRDHVLPIGEELYPTVATGSRASARSGVRGGDNIIFNNIFQKQLKRFVHKFLWVLNFYHLQHCGVQAKYHCV